MSKRIPHHLGVAEGGRKLELHADAVTQGFAILGKRGKGKSNLLGVKIEILASRGQSFVVLDPPEAHWGIRFATDDEGRPVGPSGLNVLLVGGEHGDIPLDPTGGKELAQIVVQGDISCVISMRDLGYTAQQRFAADFGEELFRINRTPRFIAFEECHNFLPQMLKFEEQKRVLHAMERIIQEGRGRGLGYALASQRPAVINKNALEMVDNLFCFGMIGPNDLQQMENWFKHHVHRDKEKLEKLIDDIAQMKPGECWFLSPEWLQEMVRFKARLRTTYHAGRTPKPGERPVNVARFTVTDAVKRLKEAFAAKQKDRQVEVQSLAEAKKRIRKLEGEVRAAQRAAPKPEVQRVADPRAVRAAVAEGTKPLADENAALRKSLRTTYDWLRRASPGLSDLAGALDRMRKDIEESLKFPQAKPVLPPLAASKVLAERGEGRSPAPATPYLRPGAHVTVQLPATFYPSDGDAKLRPGARRMLAAAATFFPNGISEGQMAAMAKVKRSGGSFSSYKSNLNTAGFIEERDGVLCATEAGMTYLGEVPKMPTSTDEVRHLWASKLRPGALRMLDRLIERGGEAMSFEELAAEANVDAAGGSFSSYLSNLRTAGLAEDAGKRMVRAHRENLFL